MFLACASAARASLRFIFSGRSPRAVRCAFSRQSTDWATEPTFLPAGKELAVAHAALPDETPDGCGRCSRKPVSGVSDGTTAPGLVLVVMTAWPTPIVPAFGAGSL